MSVRIGITGGIGSGKSVVSHLLGVMGVPVYISDTETKRLMLADAEIRAGLEALLGPEVYAGGELNKPLLASYLFGSKEHAAQVNGIVHPRVRADFRRWVQAHASCPVVGIESAILLEAGFRTEVDYVVMVYAPREVRISRAVQRDASTRRQVEARISHQMDDEEKRRQADYVILNDGETPLIPQVLNLIASLSENIPLPLPVEKIVPTIKTE